jgi:hypothetical protein
VVEHLPSKHKALSSIPSTAENKNKRKPFKATKNRHPCCQGLELIISDLMGLGQADDVRALSLVFDVLDMCAFLRCG